MVGSDQDITERNRRAEAQATGSQPDRRAADHGPLAARRSSRFAELSIRGACYAADHASGDYFNFFPLADGSTLVVIADVSGHGIEAALLVTVIHGCLRACTGLSLGLEETIKRLNAVLFDETEGDSFCTMCLVRIDLHARSLDYINAGHPAALIFDRSGMLQDITSTAWRCRSGSSRRPSSPSPVLFRLKREIWSCSTPTA